MKRNLALFAAPDVPRMDAFYFEGSIDPNSIYDFAGRSPHIRVEVRAVGSAEGAYPAARFNLSSMLGTPLYVPENPGLNLRGLFDQHEYTLSISFRHGDSGPDLATVLFDQRTDQVSGEVQAGNTASLVQIRAFINEEITLHTEDRLAP